MKKRLGRTGEDFGGGSVVFYKQGWLPITQVYIVASYAAERRLAKTENRPLFFTPDRLGPATKEALDIINHARRVGVLLGNGEVVSADPDLLRNIGLGWTAKEIDLGIGVPVVEKSAPQNFHVDLAVGTVGSGSASKLGNRRPEEIEAALRQRYGQKLGGHIVLDEVEIVPEIERRFGYSWGYLVELTTWITPVSFGDEYEEVETIDQTEPQSSGESEGLAVKLSEADTRNSCEQPNQLLKRRPGMLPKLDETEQKRLLEKFHAEFPFGVPYRQSQNVEADFIDWVEEEFQKTVKRSTIRKYLGLGRKAGTKK
ncbi:hypothetical protein [Rubellimicrobium roseum]|uniref:Uncharacterized protein n=1 Tax=Rubellimicrobium roseum TaxID=687525 RepID=A0A5C4N7K3_9RHOB|nr:hypothetical protein [Rubellimicrobium roseum]TNC66558.1 hypothetical protein FHG71_16350 [Rubellimicrobium roseum]